MNLFRSRGQADRRATGRSEWPSRLARFLVFFILSFACASPGAHAQNWTVYTNVKYGLFEQEVADFYLLNRGVNPLVIFIHGGGWQGAPPGKVIDRQPAITWGAPGTLPLASGLDQPGFALPAHRADHSAELPRCRRASTTSSPACTRTRSMLPVAAMT